MRLLKTDTLQLVEFVDRIPPYVILSHTWGRDEVTFEDLSQLPKPALRKKAGFAKIEGCCARAAADGYEYIWVDTCCIDKSSSAELSEAINSMYRWYQEAHICYAYMSDVSLDVKPQSPSQGADSTAATTLPTVPRRGAPDTPPVRPPTYRTIPSILREYDKLPRTFEHSRWFTRGWTLQELIAPAMVEFYAHDWREIGTKFSLRKVISKVTGIDIRVLEGKDPSTCHVAERMSWAANRQTTRIEDAAYCLLGIFKVHMPLIYGEGQRAFHRLQEEIMKTTEDYTMLAWGLSRYLSNKHHWKAVQRNNLADPRRPLAACALDFEVHNRATWTYSRLIADGGRTGGVTSNTWAQEDSPPLITSRGLRVSLLLMRAPRQGAGDVLAYINCKTAKPGVSADGPLSPVCLVLHQEKDTSIYVGSDDPNAAFELLASEKNLASFERKTIYLSLATADSALSQTHNHRMSSLEKNQYELEKPPPARIGESTTATWAPWKITSCFSHAVGAGQGHVQYEVPRKFIPATLFQPFDLPPSAVRLFAFEQPPSMSGDAFGIVVGHGWCDVVAIADPAFRARWGTLVRDGHWNEVLALKFIDHVAAKSHGHQGGTEADESADRVAKRVACLDVTVSLKKIRRADLNCESAIRILWQVEKT